MKCIIVIDDKDFKEHIENVIITKDNEEIWKDMIDVDYLKDHMKTLKKKVPHGSDLFNDYVNGWNDCVDEVEK